MNNTIIESINYNFLYLYKILQNTCHPHAARLIDFPPKTVFNFTHTEELKKAWYDLFEIKDETINIPFSYFMRDTRSAFALFDFLNAYDFSFRHILHIKSSLWFSRSQNLFLPDEVYRVEHSVNDIVHVSNDRVCLISKSSVYDKNGEHIYDQKNGFLIKGLRPQEAALYDALHHHAKHRPELFLNLSKKLSLLLEDEQCSRHEITIPKGLGTQYGKLSGDKNPVHTNPMMARFMGAEGAFIQGLCTINMLLAKLVVLGYENIEKLNITFCRKIYEEQTIYLLTHQGYYELVDRYNNLLAFGRIH